MNARVRLASVVLAVLVAACAWYAFSTRDEALGARKALAARLSLAAGRTASLSALRQQVTAESGRGRTAGELISTAESAAVTDGERQALRALRTCLEQTGGCADAALIDAVAADELSALKLAWATVEAAEARVQREGRVALGVGVMALLALLALAVWRERPAPVASRRDDGEVQTLLRERLEALYSARTQLGDGARFGAFGELAAALTHGLKTPLAGISASLQLSQLKLGNAHAAQAELEEALRLTDALTEQLQRFLRAAGQVGPAQQRVDVNVVLDAVRAATSPEAVARNIQFSTRAAPAGSVIEIDTALVEMALRNLVENALAFGKRLELFAEVVAAPVRVGLDGAAPTAKKYVALAVVDDGPGLPSAARRTEPGVTTRASGSGLGLAIARRVAERHQGALTLDDVEGGGTRVALVLPLVEGDR